MTFRFSAAVSFLRGPRRCRSPAQRLLAVPSAALTWAHPWEKREVCDDGKSPICVSQHPALSWDGGHRDEINQHGRSLETSDLGCRCTSFSDCDPVKAVHACSGGGGTGPLSPNHLPLFFSPLIQLD